MSWQEVKLKLSDEVKQRLADRHILEDEVKQVIHHAEETGENKAFQPDANRYLAQLRIGSATFYVDYAIENGVCAVRSAYAHKAEVKG